MANLEETVVNRLPSLDYIGRAFQSFEVVYKSLALVAFEGEQTSEQGILHSREAFAHAPAKLLVGEHDLPSCIADKHALAAVLHQALEPEPLRLQKPCAATAMGVIQEIFVLVHVDW